VAKGISRIIFENSRVFLEIVGYGLITKEHRVRIYGFLRFIFQWKIRWTGPTARLRSMVDRGSMDKRAWRAGARAHRCSPVVVEEFERDEAVAERRRDEGEERRWLELGVRELGREGKRGDEGRGCSSPFIGAKGAVGRGGRGGNRRRR
jgi:hypothetical protein